MKLLSGPCGERSFWAGAGLPRSCAQPLPTESPKAHPRPTGESNFYPPQGCLLFKYLCSLAANLWGPGNPAGGQVVLFQRMSTHTYVSGGRVPSSSIGDFLALYQAHHPLEVAGANDSSIVTRLLGIFPIELLWRRGDSL